MSQLKNKIIGISIGIRFVRTFRISDISGDIIDNILHCDKSPFDIKYFPKIKENNSREKILLNDETNDYFRINTDDLILSISVNENFDKKINFIQNSVIPYYKETLFKKYKIENIKRIGIIFHHKLDKIEKMNSLVKDLTSEKVSEVNNINLSFSKKLPTTEGMISKDVNNFKNTIYTFEQQSDEIFFNFDYQCYYEPALQDLRDTDIDSIIETSSKYLEENVYNNWLNEYGKQEK
ncbi:MAG TPA: hypothetical protein PKN54_02610 [Candidatus Cloacimonas acidaminovorans]|nr:hypothetical protein [Candidatus Cloacimonas acidaminovorans]